MKVNLKLVRETITQNLQSSDLQIVVFYIYIIIAPFSLNDPESIVKYNAKPADKDGLLTKRFKYLIFFKNRPHIIVLWG